MSERTRNIIVGITLLLGIGGVGAMLLMFGQLGAAFERGYIVQVDLPAANGLGTGSAVTMNGLYIGEVTYVQMREPSSLGVRVSAKIKADYHIPTSTHISVVPKSLMGSSGVLIMDVSGLSQEQVDQYLPTDGTALIAAGPAAANAGVPSMLREPVRQMSRLADNFEDLSDQWIQVGRDVSQVADQMSQAVSAVQQLVQQAQTGQGTIGRLANDPALYENFNDAAQRLDAVLTELQLLIEKWKAEGVPVQF